MSFPSVDTQWLFYAQLINAAAVIIAVWIASSLKDRSDTRRLRSILQPALKAEISRLKLLNDSALAAGTDPIRVTNVEFGARACPVFVNQSSAISSLDPAAATAVYEFYSFLMSTPMLVHQSSGGNRSTDFSRADGKRLSELAEVAIEKLGE